jgi:hypothetical protein
MEDFKNLILDSMNPDQSKLQNATKTITNLRDLYPRDLSQSLLTHSQSSDFQISIQSLVLYRSMLLVSNVPFEAYSNSSLKSTFYSMIHPSRPLSYLKKVGDILVVLSSLQNFEGELLTTCMSQWLISDLKPFKLLSLHILEQISQENQPAILIHQAAVLEMVWKTLENADDEVKISTCRTVCIVLALADLKDTHSRVLEAVVSILQQVRMNNLLPALEGINTLVTSYRDISETCTEKLVKFLVSLILDSSQPRETVELAGAVLNEVVTEGAEENFNSNNLIQEIIAAVFQLLFIVDHHSDLQAWINSEDSDESKLFQIGRSLLNELACLAREKIFPFLNLILQPMFKSDFWIHLHSGLTALGLVAEHCEESFLENFDEFFGVIIGHCTSEHPRLRHAGLTALGLICNAFPVVVKDRRSVDVIKVLIMNLRTENPAKVIIQASKCLINYCGILEEPHEINFLNVHLNQIQTGLMKIISSESTSTLVLMQVIDTFTSIIEISGQFSPSVSDLLFKLEASLPSQALDVKLKESSLRCMAYIVELEGFHGENEILLKMLELKTTTTKTDYIYNQVLQVITRSIIKLQSIPSFFNDFIQELLINASASVDMEFFDNASLASNEKGISAERSGSFPCKIALNSEALHNKGWACLLLDDLAQGLQTLFLPWSESCFVLMKKMLDFDFDSVMKKKSINVICSLIAINPRLEAERMTFELFSVVVPLIPKLLNNNPKSCKVLMRGLKKVSVILKDFSFLGLSVAQYVLEVLSSVVSICVGKMLSVDYCELGVKVQDLVDCSAELLIVLIESFDGQFKMLMVHKLNSFFQLMMGTDDILVSAGVKIFKSYVKTFREVPANGSLKAIDRLLQLCHSKDEDLQELSIETLIILLKLTDTSIHPESLPKLSETCNFLLKSSHSKALSLELSQLINSKTQTI